MLHHVFVPLDINSYDAVVDTDTPWQVAAGS